MTTASTNWHPRVGDRIRIKRTGLIETVQRINGRDDREDARYVIVGAPAAMLSTGSKRSRPSASQSATSAPRHPQRSFRAPARLADAANSSRPARQRGGTDARSS